MVFPIYMNSFKKEQKLDLSHPFDARCSTFFAHTIYGKTCLLPYEVHKALHTAGYAPDLLGCSHRPAICAVVIEYLTPTGSEDG